MKSQTEITPEEYEVIDNVVGNFMSKMRWDHRWEQDDVRQELLIFWFKQKQSGWSKPKEWKGVMGRCLQSHLVNLQEKTYAKKRYPGETVLSLDKLIEEGCDFPDKRLKPICLDFLELLNQEERQLCELIMEGKTKKEIALLLGHSRSSIDRRLRDVREVADEKV